jgi:MFS family permease
MCHGFDLSRRRLTEVQGHDLTAGRQSGVVGLVMTVTPPAALHPIRVAFAGLCLVVVSLAIGRFVYTPILPFMVEALRLSKTEAGLIGSANFLGYLAGSMITAKPKLPGGRRIWMLLSIVVCTVSTAGMGLTSSLALFIAIRFVSGAGTAISFILACALVIDYLAKAGRLELARVHFSGVGIGIILEAAVVDLLARLGTNWSGLWLANGLICLIMTVLAFWLLPDIGEAPPVPRGNVKNAIDRRLLKLIIAYGLFGFGYVITTTFISVLVRTDPQLQSIEPYIWLIVGASSIPSLALWDWTGRKIGYLRAYTVASLIEAIGVTLSVSGSSQIAVIASAILLGGTMTGLGSLAMIGARELIAEGDTSRVFGVMTTWFSVGQIAGPIFAGMLAESTGSFRFPSLVATLFLIVSAGLVWTRRPIGSAHLIGPAASKKT